MFTSVQMPPLLPAAIATPLDPHFIDTSGTKSAILQKLFQ